MIIIIMSAPKSAWKVGRNKPKGTRAKHFLGLDNLLSCCDNEAEKKAVTKAFKQAEEERKKAEKQWLKTAAETAEFTQPLTRRLTKVLIVLSTFPEEEVSELIKDCEKLQKLEIQIDFKSFLVLIHRILPALEDLLSSSKVDMSKEALKYFKNCDNHCWGKDADKPIEFSAAKEAALNLDE
jgi:hypothetical protein